MFKKTRVYLDYAAATPLSKEAFKAMKPFLLETYGNPSAIHQEGARAKVALESARTLVGKTLQVRPEWVTFVSGGTESNNLAIVGTIETLHQAGRAYSEMEIITTRIEHPSVLAAFTSLEQKGVVVRYVNVNDVGVVQLGHLGALLSSKTVLVSCAYANSEIGVVQPVRAIARVLEAAEKKFTTKIRFHLDAAQAPLWLPCQFDSLNVDLLSLDVGKCNGPKGVGILVQGKRQALSPVLFGGGQESGLRPGTENVAGIIGSATALYEAQFAFKARAERVTVVRDQAIQYLLQEIPTAVLNGPTGDDRLANNINISILGLDTEFATIVLDKHGFAVSTKSACAGAGGGESAVVREISGDPTRAASTLRISLGPDTSLSDVKRLTNILKEHTQKMSQI